MAGAGGASFVDVVGAAVDAGADVDEQVDAAVFAVARSQEDLVELLVGNSVGFATFAH